MKMLEKFSKDKQFYVMSAMKGTVILRVRQRRVAGSIHRDEIDPQSARVRFTRRVPDRRPIRSPARP